METKEAYKGHIVTLPFPHQGHMNAIAQFSKRLASKGLKITIATTHHSLSITNNFNPPKTNSSPISFHQIFDEVRKGGPGGYKGLIERFKSIGSRNLTKLISQHENSNHPIKCLVYDASVPWAFDVAKQFGLPCAAFFMESCTDVARYYPIFLDMSGLSPLPEAFPIAGLPEPRILSVPTLGPDNEGGRFSPIVLHQLSFYNNIDKADWVLFSSFDELEQETVKWMSHFWTVKTIGPCLPSFYLDKRVEYDDYYCFNTCTQKTDDDDCFKWLDNKPNGSVVYVSFGTVANLSKQQIEQLAGALVKKGPDFDYFLWVVKQNEENKLPANFVPENGLVVNWIPQLSVLAHPAVGCFVSHCGWNSTVEAISLGVPVVAVPQFMDQMTNAHFIDKVWGVGVEAKADDEGLTSGDEITRCIHEVMGGGDRGKEIKANVAKWKKMAKEAVDEGGSSDKCIDEIVAKIVAAA